MLSCVGLLRDAQALFLQTFASGTMFSLVSVFAVSLRRVSWLCFMQASTMLRGKGIEMGTGMGRGIMKG